jgi:hypothetical protein
LPLSHDFTEKAVQAAIAAIEIYNKPDFHFREEAFSLLMTNSLERQGGGVFAPPK